jgi:hypothetical protein
MSHIDNNQFESPPPLTHRDVRAIVHHLHGGPPLPDDELLGVSLHVRQLVDLLVHSSSSESRHHAFWGFYMALSEWDQNTIGYRTLKATEALKKLDRQVSLETGRPRRA